MLSIQEANMKTLTTAAMASLFAISMPAFAQLDSGSHFSLYSGQNSVAQQGRDQQRKLEQPDSKNDKTEDE